MYRGIMATRTPFYMGYPDLDSLSLLTPQKNRWVRRGRELTPLPNTLASMGKPLQGVLSLAAGVGLQLLLSSPNPPLHSPPQEGRDGVVPQGVASKGTSMLQKKDQQQRVSETSITDSGLWDSLYGAKK